MRWVPLILFLISLAMVLVGGWFLFQAVQQPQYQSAGSVNLPVAGWLILLRWALSQAIASGALFVSGWVGICLTAPRLFDRKTA